MLGLNGPLGVLRMRLQSLQPGLPPTSLSRLWTTARLRRHFNTLERQVFLHNSAAALDLSSKSECVTTQTEVLGPHRGGVSCHAQEAENELSCLAISRKSGFIAV